MRRIFLLISLVVGMNTAQAVMASEFDLKPEPESAVRFEGKLAATASEDLSLLQKLKKNKEVIQRGLLLGGVAVGASLTLRDAKIMKYQGNSPQDSLLKIWWENSHPSSKDFFLNKAAIGYPIGYWMMQINGHIAASLIFSKWANKAARYYNDPLQLHYSFSTREKAIMALDFIADAFHVGATFWNFYFDFTTTLTPPSLIDKRVSPLFFGHIMHVILLHSIGAGLGLLKWGIETYFPDKVSMSALR